MDCIFCKIVAGEIPCDRIFEDEKVLAFKDLNPEAPNHVLVIPKIHIQSLKHAEETDLELLGHIQLTIVEIAERLGIAESGFRVVANTGKQGGQTVDHLHYHLLGGRFMQWPPG